MDGEKPWMDGHAEQSYMIGQEAGEGDIAVDESGYWSKYMQGFCILS